MIMVHTASTDFLQIAAILFGLFTIYLFLEYFFSLVYKRHYQNLNSQWRTTRKLYEILQACNEFEAQRDGKYLVIAPELQFKPIVDGELFINGKVFARVIDFKLNLQ